MVKKTLTNLMRLLIIPIAAVLLGCGGSNEGKDPLANTAWTMRVPGLLCDHQTTFYSDGKYLDSITCQLGDGNNVAQVNRGTYGDDGRTVTIEVKESSCSTATSGEFDFAVAGDSLLLGTSTGSLVTLTRLIFLPGEPQSTPIGCFDTVDWAFTPMAIHALGSKGD
jgi:hypothetical protein